MAGITITEYQTLILGTLDWIKIDILAPIAPDSHIETRYISSEGNNNEEWLAYLRDADNVVDVWLLTFNMFKGLSEADPNKGSVGTFTKPVTVVIDYYADYRFGSDVVGDVGLESTTNTEHEFLKKIVGVDLALENKKGCLKDSIMIVSWDFRLKLRRFDTATTHWASGILSLDFSELFLQN